MGKKMRTVIVSLITACLCMTLVIGATFALFSDQVSVNNHLSAGNLKVGLERISFEKRILNAEGVLETTTDDTTVDLVENGAKLFEMNNIVPGSRYSAELRVSNLGDTAFDYGVRLLWNTTTDATADQSRLASQILITISVGAENKASFMLDSAHDVGLGAISAGGAAQTFGVSAEFVNDDDNNSVQDIELDFDLQVYANQKTE